MSCRLHDRPYQDYLILICISKFKNTHVLLLPPVFFSATKISFQLAPFGVRKITHFEMACKAVDATPTVALFRRFFHLTKNGEWFTIQRYMNDLQSQFTYNVSPSVKLWKNKFFWVSADLLPFPHISHNPQEALSEITLRDSVLNIEHYNLLVSNKTHIRPFSEDMLVFGGLSPY
ncbi:hypothetical protein R6Q59_033539 [Mikania micrantha]